jgi:hypothetical protein
VKIVKKLAIFVEGQTEQIFLERLLREIAGKHNISIEIKSQEKHKIATLIMRDPITSNTKFYVLIYNSAGDSRVVSDMKEQYTFLAASGYERVIGLRDIYPITGSQISKLKIGLRSALPIGKIPIDVVLAIMEVEAWFLAEYHHFSQIDPTLTPERIHQDLGFNPQTDSMEERPHPAADMHQIYQLVGKAYKKREPQVSRIVQNLDYEFIYIHLVKSVPSLGEFVNYINQFML